MRQCLARAELRKSVLVTKPERTPTMSIRRIERHRRVQPIQLVLDMDQRGYSRELMTESENRASPRCMGVGSVSEIHQQSTEKGLSGWNFSLGKRAFDA